jgi:carbon-monoxide dehydrogenase medium subunit
MPSIGTLVNKGVSHMTRNPSSYYRPKTVAEAQKLLEQPHVKSALLSGGALRLATTDDPDYESLIDLQAVEGLSAIELAADGTLRLGASATLEQVAAHSDTPPLLGQVITRPLPWNRRNGITVGEAVEHGGDLPEFTAALLAFGAVVIFATPDEQRIPLSELGRHLEQPRLPRKGVITGVRLDPPSPLRIWGAAHVARTPADAAIVSAMAVLDVGADGMVVKARLALSGVWEEVARLATVASAQLVEGVLDEGRIAEALAALDEEIAPVADYLGSVEYRRAMAGVLARRALEGCQARLAQGHV